jgi:hypothetical protein
MSLFLVFSGIFELNIDPALILVSIGDLNTDNSSANPSLLSLSPMALPARVARSLMLASLIFPREE